MKHINWDIDWGAVFVVLVCIVLLCLATFRWTSKRDG